MATVSKIYTYDDADAPTLAAIADLLAATGSLYSAGPVAGAGIVDSSFTPYFYGTLDASTTTWQADGIIDSFGAYYPTGIFDGSHLYNAYGILYDSLGTPTYAGKGIMDEWMAYSLKGILYEDVNNSNQLKHASNGIYDETNHYTAGIYDGTIYHAYGIMYAVTGTPTFATTGIFAYTSGDPSTYYPYGIFDIYGIYNPHGILNNNSIYSSYGILDSSYVDHATGIWDGTYYYAWYGSGIYVDAGGGTVNYYATGILPTNQVWVEKGILYFNGSDYICGGQQGVLGVDPYTGNDAFSDNGIVHYYGGYYYYAPWSGGGIYTVSNQYVSYNATGIFDGTTRYATGIYDGTYYVPQPADGYYIFAYASGILANIANDGIVSSNAYNLYGILYDNVGTPTYTGYGIYEPYTGYHINGILDTGGNPDSYHATGIFDTNNPTGMVDGYASRGLYGSGVFSATGAMNATDAPYGPNGVCGDSGVYAGSVGIIDQSGNFHSTGIFDGTIYHDYGIYAYDNGSPTWYADGVYDNSIGTNQGYRYSFGLALRNQFDELINNTWYGSGVYEHNVNAGSTEYHSSGIFDGTYYTPYGILYDNSGTPTSAESGIFYYGTYFSYGILYNNGFSSSYALTGILDYPNYFYNGIFDGTNGTDGTRYDSGVLKNNIHYDLEKLDVLGAGLM